MERRDELAQNLAAVQQRVAQACEQHGRAPQDVAIVVVTKTWPASDVAILVDLGVTDVGENRHPEAGDKHRELVESGIDLRWHFVGGLQTNKAGAVARYADVVHSVDRAKLALALDRGAEAAGRVLRCLIQVDFDTSDPGRAGVPPQDVPALADVLVGECPHLELGGVMTVAPLGQDPAPSFAQLREISAALTRTVPSATTISAGMSEDFEVAIAHGATHVRVGRSVLGQRPVLQ
jgi:pyridoxal phosphate enzyme (YggS family)